MSQFSLAGRSTGITEAVEVPSPLVVLKRRRVHSFVQGREEVDFERLLIELNPWMSEQTDDFGDKNNLNYVAGPSFFDGVWFVLRTLS